MKLLPILLLAAIIIVAGCSQKAPPPGNIPPLTVQQDKGLAPVNLVFINDSSCGKCQNLNGVLDSLKKENVNLDTVLLVQYNSTSGEKLVNQYKVKHVPAVLISYSITKYPLIGQKFMNAGVPPGGFYLLQSPPVYKEIATGKIRGLANLTFIQDETCGQCFKLAPMKTALGQLGFRAQTEKIVNLSSAEGQKLIKHYNITKVPTVLLTGDLEVYENLNASWTDVGTVESDGTYVLRDMNPLGPGVVYKDLSTSQTVNQS